MLYAMLVIPVAYVIIFNYVPMYGIQIAFRDFSIRKGYWDSPFVGFTHFISFFNGYYFWSLIRNTLTINIYGLTAGFICPILLALMINEVGNKYFKKSVQMLTYLPRFISVVIVVSMISQLFSLQGIVNNVLSVFGLERIPFMSEENTFIHMYVWSDIWQMMGYNSIIYVAVLSNVNTELYEAARMDGANRLRIIWHINIPSIAPTITILLILAMGGLMNLGFDKIYLMQNPLNINSSRVISTYVYEVGLLSMQYSFSTAVNLFNTVINFILLFFANTLSRRVSETSLW